MSRESIVKYLNSELCGPVGGEGEILHEKPHKRYLMGILFPSASVEDEVDEATPDEMDTSVSLASEFKPSAMALSFAVSGNAEIRIIINCGVYEKDGSDWCRTGMEQTLFFNCLEEGSKTDPVLEGKGKLTIKKRPWASGYILTVALTNAIAGSKILDPADCLYQSGLECHVDKGSFEEYPNAGRFRFDEEQEELELLYRKRVNWAVGHGCSCSWDKNSAVPSWVKSASIPSAEVFGFSTSLDFNLYPDVPKNVLNLQYLSNTKVAENQLVQDLHLFVDAYAGWIEHQKNEALPEKFEGVRQRIVERLVYAEQRMRRGIKALSSNINALKSFRMANQVMLMQMIHSGPDFSGKVSARNVKGFKRPDYSSPDYIDKEWRPFQLAFQLMVIESLVYTETDDYSESRDIVDLLWFPTGGGKTEAYLAIAAWEIIFRRLEDGPKGAGTVVIKRYTLRLLTTQQFQRAGTMICALEILRRDHVHLLGAAPISLGLWVGQDSAPNKFTSGDVDKPAALEKANAMFDEEEPVNPFQLQHCPWCGTSIVPKKKTNDKRDYGVIATESSFDFYCPTDDCDFHQHLPVQVVDEALYKNPPSMLIGTVDKFARMTWLSSCRAFFGNNGEYNPPSLIIQDELHLISGPLGTIAGIYEAGLDALIKHLGGRAKVIAATATIRAASQQSRRLFGRNVQVFPPPGIDEADSFYSREDRSVPGRLYLGVMPSGHTGQTAKVHTAAAILQAPIESGLENKEKDTWWTLPIYHNSRRELGATMTIAMDDIPARIGVIASDKNNMRKCDVVEELSANVKGYQIPEVLEKLKLSINDKGTVDILPCTNMISVGVDISRLGVMMINGQPKTTSEYIQASSRVGRDRKRPPAIILTLFSPSKPRDRSHYEIFNTYHQALYRHVEPTSITPWALPARDRALHAALVELVRLSEYLLGNDEAGNFNKDDPKFKPLYINIRQRILDAATDMDQLEIEKLIDHLDRIVDTWHLLARDAEVNRYESEKSGKQFKPLLKPFGNKSNSGIWKTLNSMRNVDTETTIRVWGEE